jgi:hypothetical protein
MRSFSQPRNWQTIAEQHTAGEFARWHNLAAHDGNTGQARIVFVVRNLTLRVRSLIG